MRDVDGKLIGIIGRSTLGEDRRIAAKYLNPPRTVVSDKSEALYTPAGWVSYRMPTDGQVVVVEGSIDALAVAAAARAAGLSSRFQPVPTSGLGFSDHQVDWILALHPRAPVIAFDGDQAGETRALSSLPVSRCADAKRRSSTAGGSASGLVARRAWTRGARRTHPARMPRSRRQPAAPTPCRARSGAGADAGCGSAP